LYLLLLWQVLLQIQIQSQSLLLKSPNPLDAFCEVMWTAKDFQLNVLQALASLKKAAQYLLLAKF
jgi:hypothetical protein